MRTEEQIARTLAASADTIEGEAARFAFAALDESRRQVDALRDAGQQASYSLLKAQHMKKTGLHGFPQPISATIRIEY